MAPVTATINTNIHNYSADNQSINQDAWDLPNRTFITLRPKQSNHLFTNSSDDRSDWQLYDVNGTLTHDKSGTINNYWALLAILLVFCTAAGNILVCLAIAWERRLQNVTNYFLMSLAITDLMVAILVMPLGILTLVRGKSLNTDYEKYGTQHKGSIFFGKRKLCRQTDRPIIDQNTHRNWSIKPQSLDAYLK
jgi:7 transmembrane receptor (rhodopsin family)